MPLSFRTGQPRWMDLLSRDPDTSLAFYTGLLGWEAQVSPPEYGGYVSFSKDGKAVGGMMRNPDDSRVADNWTVYLEVADAQATADAARDNDGEVIQLGDVGDMGVWLVLTDATGARVGGWQNRSHSGFEATDGAGTPVWAELHTRDWDVYLGVENANEAAVRVTELGGTMLERVIDSPYGRTAHAVDPTGAKFAILQVD